MKDKIIMPTPEAARLTLEQFCAIYRLPITIGQTVSGRYHASLRDVEILNNGLVRSAVGFGSTEANALTALAAALSGNKLRIRPTHTETVAHYLKYGN